MSHTFSSYESCGFAARFCARAYAVRARKPSFELFGRESLVTILEHQDEAQGNKVTTKALFFKAKQMKMRYCAISVCKNNSKKRPDLNFFEFPSEKKLRKKWNTFLPASWQGVSLRELTHMFSAFQH